MNNSVRVFSEVVNSVKIKTYRQLELNMDLTWVKNKKYKVLHTIKELLQCVSFMAKAPLLAVDTETTGLNIYNLSYNNPVRDNLVGICLSWKPNTGIYIPVCHTEFDNLSLTKTLEILQPLLETKPLVTHNGLYDYKVFYALGVKLNIVHDTHLLQVNLDSTVGRVSRGLKDLIYHFFGYYPVEFEDIFEYKKDFRLFRFVSEDVARVYACADADHTLMLLPILMKYLNPTQVWGYERDVQLIPHIARSEYEGKSVNFDLLKELNEINNINIDKLEELIFTYTGTALNYCRTGKLESKYYRFNINSSTELAIIMFKELHYPVPRGKDNKHVNKAILKYLSTQKSKEILTINESILSETLKSDIINHTSLHYSSKEAILVDKIDFIYSLYPLASLVTKYRKLMKYKTSFFAPLLTGELEGRYFSSISMARTATFRLIDVIQTLDKGLKQCISPPEDFYMVGYDYCQVEARDMIGESGDKALIEMLDNPEADYHVIAASQILKLLPEQVTDSQRSQFKSINFGIPYGIGAAGIVKNRFNIGFTPEEEKRLIAETKVDMQNWEKGMKPVKLLLDRHRDRALQIARPEEIPWTLEGKPAGYVENTLGRRRWFDLSNLTKSKIASIRRCAGNFPIQSHARDVFAEGLLKLATTCVSNNLMDIKVPDDYSPLGYHFENKVIFMMYVHDEIQMIVHKSINPRWILRTIYDNCVVHLKGYPTFYIDAGIIKNWYESKSGIHGVPASLLDRIPKDLPIFTPYEEDIQEQVDREILEFVKSRVAEEFSLLGVDCTKDFNLLLSTLKQYKSYFAIKKAKEMVSDSPVFNKPCRKFAKYKDVGYDDEFLASVEALFDIKINLISDVKIILPVSNAVDDVKDNISDCATVSDDFYDCDTTDEFDTVDVFEDYIYTNDVEETAEQLSLSSNNNELLDISEDLWQKNLLKLKEI